MNRKLAIVSLFMLPPLMVFAVSCGVQSQTTEQQPVQLTPGDQTNNNDDSLDARIATMLSSDRDPGKVVVGLQDGVTEDEAYSLFAAQGFSKDSVAKQEYLEQVYLLTFSEESRDMKSVLKALLTDGRVKYAEPQYRGSLSSIQQ